MNDNAAKIWFLYMFIMFMFVVFLGRGWLIGIIIGMIIGIVNIK